LEEKLGSVHTTVGIDRNEPKLFSVRGIFVGLTEEPQSVRRDKLINRSRKNVEFPLILLNGARVFLATEDQFFFHLTPRLHLVCRDSRCEQD